MTIEQYAALFIAMFVVAIIPGPAVFAITSASMTDGFKRGAYITVGLVCADYVFILLAIFGLSFMAEMLGEAFIIFKYCCAAWLIWMGIGLFRTKTGNTSTSTPVFNRHSAILMGFLLTLSNPKAIMFYVALFPTFVDVGTMVLSDVIGVMLCATLAFGLSNLGYAWLSSQARRLVSGSNIVKHLRQVAGSVLVASGISVAVRT